MPKDKNVKAPGNSLAKSNVQGPDQKKKKRAARPPRQKGRMKEYFKGVKLETKKVVWPTRKELLSYTIVVLFTCAFFALMIWGVDSAFLAALSKILGIEI
jgi:preprotein translocase subunit SecE